MPEARVGRALYRALLRGGAALEREIARNGLDSAREVGHLRQAAKLVIPRRTRADLDIQGDSTYWIQRVARRLSNACASSSSRPDITTGFAVLRRVNKRIGALSRLVRPISSHTDAGGLRIVAKSVYAGVELQRFCFRYSISITNHGPAPVRLVKWSTSVAELDGRERHNSGLGVLGLFPTIEPGGSFQYDAPCKLRTPLGTQRSYFLFYAAPVDNHINATATTGHALHVNVPPFSYRSPVIGGTGEKPPEAPALAVTPPHKRSRGRNRKRRRWDDCEQVH